MEALFSFAQEIGNSLAYLLPTLCYVTGSSFLLGSVYGIYSRGKGENGPASNLFVCAALFTVGASFLSFPDFLNMGNKSLGFTTTASMSGSDATPMKFSAQDIQTGINKGPTALLVAFLHLFRMYFACYGALLVYWGMIRQVGRMKGQNNTSTSVNLLIIVGSFILMNADTVAAATCKKLGYLT
ncbi:hypothetical protein [Acetobacter sp. LMG 32666]|uniref:hypothetical protein n=1 Tax=Acetobacter sp. LMG 32666 TaxID=2959295 RepID=UPI0030C7D6A4